VDGARGAGAEQCQVLSGRQAIGRIAASYGPCGPVPANAAANRSAMR